MPVSNKFLFNFAVSYSGGGYKRLYEYAKWFNKNGGAWFIIHPHCKNLISQFQNNQFFIASQPQYQRIFNDCKYLDNILTIIDIPNLYYSYGIPIYNKIGKLNWFHLSNVLPLVSRGISLSLFDRLKLSYLGRKINHNFKNANIISAESTYSLGLIDIAQKDKLFLSVNGSNDELNYLQTVDKQKKENIAVVIGTYRYKSLRDSWHIFEMLRKKEDDLKFVLIGNEKNIPKDLQRNKNIIITGILERTKVIEYLHKAKYYISTTQIENSYNAASEGVLFADESYISDIEPHRELLTNTPFNQISVPHINKPVIHIKREDISSTNLKTWENVIEEMMKQVLIKLAQPGN